jgi:tripartite-type tricarboxylate transporter receptor subunit TctC
MLLQSAFAGCSLLAAPLVMAQAPAWPNKPLRVVVPFAPGGPPDVIARLVAPKLGEALGQSVIIENRSGAGGNIGTLAVAKSAPDGYTILFASSALVVNTNFPESGYSAEKDFVPVTIVAAQPNVLIAHPSVPAKTLPELLAYARDQKLAFASPGSGTTPHLTGENLFNVEAKLGLPAAHFRGAGPAAAGVMGNEPPIGSVALSGPIQNIRAGKLRAIAVSSARRQPLLPDVPTLVELGYPSMVDYTWVGVFLPAGTPQPIARQLGDALQRVLKDPDVRQRIEAAAFEIVADAPDRTADYVKSEVARWGSLVRRLGIKPE